MADLKISQLTSVTLPLAGTEVLPIVQSSSTKKVATDDLTVKNIRSNATTGILQIAGPAGAATRVMTTPDANFTAARTDAAQSFTGDQTLATGNLIQGTAAKGYNFSANTPAAGKTSTLLNWYEEGTWTPVYTPGSGSFTTMTMDIVSAKYTRIGRQVTLTAYIRTTNVDATGASGALQIGGLPFTVGAWAGVTISYASAFNVNHPSGGYANQTGTTITLSYRTTANGGTSDSAVSDLTTGASTANVLIFTATYFV